MSPKIIVDLTVSRDNLVSIVMNGGLRSLESDSTTHADGGAIYLWEVQDEVFARIVNLGQIYRWSRSECWTDGEEDLKELEAERARQDEDYA